MSNIIQGLYFDCSFMIFCINKNKKPLPMVTEAQGNRLLKSKKAVVHRQYPFVIRMKEECEPEPKGYTLKIDPGSKHTGLALVDSDGSCCWLGLIEHNGEIVRKRLEDRSGVRRNRRQRETRYRKPKWGNCYKKKDSRFSADSPRPDGWLPPSVKSVADNIDSWISKISRFCNLETVVIETVKFDSQKMDNADIQGVEYQQGTLAGYEIRDFLLEKYQHTCQYCGGESKDKRLEVEHMLPKSRGGTDKINNLSLACHTCNQLKGAKTVEEWKDSLKSKRSSVDKTRVKCLEKVIANKKVGSSDRYSAWVNSSRFYLIECAKKYVDDVQVSYGGVTRYNRMKAKLPKEHYYDALCVKTVPDNLKFRTHDVLVITSWQKQRRMLGTTNACGILGGKAEKGSGKRDAHLSSRQKMYGGLKTGDIVVGYSPRTKKIHKGGKLYVSEGDRCTMTYPGEKRRGSFKCENAKLIQRGDGFYYTVIPRTMPETSITTQQED